MDQCLVSGLLGALVAQQEICVRRASEASSVLAVVPHYWHHHVGAASCQICTALDFHRSVVSPTEDCAC